VPQSHTTFALAVTTTPTVNGISEEVEATKSEALAALLANSPRPEARPRPTDSPAVSRMASRLAILPFLYFLALTKATIPAHATPTAALALRGLIGCIVTSLTAPTPRPKLYPSGLVTLCGQ